MHLARALSSTALPAWCRTGARSAGPPCRLPPPPAPRAGWSCGKGCADSAYTQTKGSNVLMCNSKQYFPLRRKTNFGGLTQRENLRLRYLHVGTKNAKICRDPNAKHKICVSPNVKPQREPMEYRLPWVPNAKLLRWACTVHVVCVNFSCVG